MTSDQFSKVEAIAFGERLDAFAETLSSHERTFLYTILRDAEARPDEGSRFLNDAGTGTFREIVLAIHQVYLSSSISVNPQPIPPGPLDPPTSHLI